jgi:hypothetical protein
MTGVAPGSRRTSSMVVAIICTGLVVPGTDCTVEHGHGFASQFGKEQAQITGRGAAPAGIGLGIGGEHQVHAVTGHEWHQPAFAIVDHRRFVQNASGEKQVRAVGLQCELAAAGAVVGTQSHSFGFKIPDGGIWSSVPSIGGSVHRCVRAPHQYGRLASFKRKPPFPWLVPRRSRLAADGQRQFEAFRGFQALYF